MKQFSIYPPLTTTELRPGKLLIAEPLLSDTNFTRSVILLCEHGEEGSLGFVLNHPTDIQLNKLVHGMPSEGPAVFKGGPVQTDTLHMLHRIPGRLGHGKKIANGIYWGGSFDDLHNLSTSSDCDDADVRLFLGYSGWAPGQLEAEIKEGSWLVTDANPDILFGTCHENVWKKAIASLGRKYAHLAHIPTDPQLN